MKNLIEINVSCYEDKKIIIGFAYMDDDGKKIKNHIIINKKMQVESKKSPLENDEIIKLLESELGDLSKLKEEYDKKMIFIEKMNIKEYNLKEEIEREESYAAIYEKGNTEITLKTTFSRKLYIKISEYKEGLEMIYFKKNIRKEDSCFENIQKLIHHNKSKRIKLMFKYKK